ncbi:hypothetical protein F4806DRAFT_236209 [Annulohypoxylon nitens]|nr:hypothetical protein F4806DRAFT_236209 [Annulohypoxylon nitens]
MGACNVRVLNPPPPLLWDLIPLFLSSRLRIGTYIHTSIPTYHTLLLAIHYTTYTLHTYIHIHFPHKNTYIHNPYVHTYIQYATRK